MDKNLGKNATRNALEADLKIGTQVMLDIKVTVTKKDALFLSRTLQLASGQFHFKAELLQINLHFIAMITLDLDRG